MMAISVLFRRKVTDKQGSLTHKWSLKTDAVYCSGVQIIAKWTNNDKLRTIIYYSILSRKITFKTVGKQLHFDLGEQNFQFSLVGSCKMISRSSRTTDGKIRTAGVGAFSQSDSSIEDSG